jgi:signal transduction histidine kinase
MVPASPSFAESVLASLGSGVLALDREGRVGFANEEARRLLAPALAAGDWRGLDARELLAAEPKLLHRLLAVCAGRGRLSRAELHLEGQGGAAAIGASLLPVCDAAGAAAGAVLLFRDLAPIERQEEQDQIRARLVALGQMAADLAHEIRNPLASLEVLAGLLRRRVDVHSEERELVDGLLLQLRDLTRIVSTSLDFVRPQALRLVVCPPVRLVESALRRALPSDGSGPRVERHFETPLPGIAVDEEEIVAALANLIGNACEALRRVDAEQRRLSLHVAARAGEVAIAIADTGPGVPVELRQKIFQPFFTTRARGSGIGLASAQKAIAGHGGAIELDDGPGPGATFRVHLPIAPEAVG